MNTAVILKEKFMSITPEQFREIIKDVVTEENKERDKKIMERFDTLQDGMDYLIKENQKFDIELASNIQAHNRLTRYINEIRRKLDMKEVPELV